jgi:hypothetical protein
VEGIFANRGSATSITARGAIDPSLLLSARFLFAVTASSAASQQQGACDVYNIAL